MAAFTRSLIFREVILESRSESISFLIIAVSNAGRTSEINPSSFSFRLMGLVAGRSGKSCCEAMGGRGVPCTVQPVRTRESAILTFRILMLLVIQSGKSSGKSYGASGLIASKGARSLDVKTLIEEESTERREDATVLNKYLSIQSLFGAGQKSEIKV
ncbi:hypothetical protein TNCV_2945781 [Trichonephila clavipes]|nr:hypothetical protein TNCV_2945781 [Trichonephila clavipes]